jgi:large subunit ribosomal protein L3
MPTRKSPRRGSLQYWPRKRAAKFLPSVNWNAIKSGKNLKGFICYKAGMASAYVKDNTEHSLTKGKNITIPVTILECPPMKIFSVRFYKDGKVASEVLAESLDKELKRKVKVPKDKTKLKKLDSFKAEDYNDIRIIAYSVVKKTGLKKKPDLSEIGIAGAKGEEKLNYIKENINKEISVLDSFEKGELIDLRGLTKGKGFQGAVKRFGVKLRFHKTEKGQRKVGSIGPWHPARVTFRVPMPGQLGMFTRAVYNGKIVNMGKSSENPIKNIKNYGDIKTDYILVYGSVQGSAKRQLIATHNLRSTKKQVKKDYDLIELR